MFATITYVLFILAVIVTRIFLRIDNISVCCVLMYFSVTKIKIIIDSTFTFRWFVYNLTLAVYSKRVP